MLCKSKEMYLSHLCIEVEAQDIKLLVPLILDHIRCNESHPVGADLGRAVRHLQDHRSLVLIAQAPAHVVDAAA